MATISQITSIPYSVWLFLLAFMLVARLMASWLLARAHLTDTIGLLTLADRVWCAVTLILTGLMVGAIAIQIVLGGSL